MNSCSTRDNLSLPSIEGFMGTKKGRGKSTRESNDDRQHTHMQSEHNRSAIGRKVDRKLNWILGQSQINCRRTTQGYLKDMLAMAKPIRRGDSKVAVEER